MDFAYGETVVRQRGTPVVDPYSGLPTGLDWTTPTLLTIEGCSIFLGGSIEPTQDARTPIISDFDVLAPFGSDVMAADRMVIPRSGGLTCDVVGHPFDVHHPMTGWEPGQIIHLKITEG